MTAKTIAPMAMILALVMAALPAAADHGSKNDDRRIEKVARKLGKATDDLYCDLVYSDLRRSWNGWKALHAVRRLDRRAKDFYAHVDRNGFDRHARYELVALERAFHRADRRLDRVYLGRESRRDFRRVAKLMDRLETRVASYDPRDRRHRGDRRGERHRRERVAYAW